MFLQDYTFKGSVIVGTYSTSKDTDGKYVRFVFNGDHHPGPLVLNTAKNTRDLIQIIELVMGDPDWEGARSKKTHLTGEGAMRELRRLLTSPIMERKGVLGVVLADRPSDILGVFHRHNKSNEVHTHTHPTYSLTHTSVRRECMHTTLHSHPHSHSLVRKRSVTFGR